MRTLAAALLLGAVMLAPAFAGEPTPEAAARAFYGVYIASPRAGGVPDAAGIAKLQPHLSARLAGLLADAARAEEDFAQATKGQVPPLLEGDIFTSMFEGATKFEIGACTAGGGTATCAVSLIYDDHTAKPVTWTDSAVLTQGADGWRLDDIGYGGTWDFGNKGKLSETLKFAIANARGG